MTDAQGVNMEGAHCQTIRTITREQLLTMALARQLSVGAQRRRRLISSLAPQLTTAAVRMVGVQTQHQLATTVRQASTTAAVRQLFTAACARTQITFGQMQHTKMAAAQLWVVQTAQLSTLMPTQIMTMVSVPSARRQRQRRQHRHHCHHRCLHPSRQVH